MKTLCRLFTLLLLCLWGQTSLLWADDGYEFRGGTCVLRGQIKNMGWMPKHLTLHLRNLFLNQDANYLVQVRPDGSIQENIPSEAVWKNMATGIPGVHYRIEETLSNEIFSQYGLTGWPSYLIIDKNGHLIYLSFASKKI